MKQRIFAGIVAAVFTLAVTVASSNGVANAQTPSSSAAMAVSPPLFELNANPGQTLEHEIRVDNLTDQPLRLTVDRRDFTAQGEEGQVDLKNSDAEPNDSYSLSAWINTNPTEATLQPRASQVFKFSVAVPLNAEPGGHFGSIIFKTDAKPVEGGTGAAIAQEVGSLLLVKVAGDIEEKATIASFSTGKSLWEGAPITFVSRIENQGNVFFKPRGTITITNTFGREVAKLQLDERNVLPESIRRLTNEWKPRLTMGHYTATLAVTYGSNNQVITSTTQFYIIPYRLIGMILLAVGVLAFLVYRGRDRLRTAAAALRGK
jgi:hypothetical protein